MKMAIKNKKVRLGMEIGAVAAVVLAVVGVRFVPWLLAQPVAYADPYADYQKLYNAVASYDYARGADAALERRIDAALENTNADLIQTYYNLKAKGEYYQRTGRFAVAVAAFEEARPQVPSSDEAEYIYMALAKCYRAMGEWGQAQVYEGILEGSYVVEEEEEEIEGNAE